MISLDIIHHPVFYLKRNVSVAEICLRLHVETTQLGPPEDADIIQSP
jgi:hypothetical protein